MNRVSTLIGLGLLMHALLGCGGGSPAPQPDVPAVLADVTVTIDNRPAAVAAAPAVNPRLLGSNTQWTDNGDGMLLAGTSIFEPGALNSAVDLAPTVLRYPGGTQADAYHFAKGIGPSRGTNLHVFSPTNLFQTVTFGTDEFLHLADRVGAAPMITLNVITAPPSESAAWVSYVNGTPVAGVVPRVRDWEIGNEPYLTNAQHPEFDISATQFATLYDAHAAAVLAVDPRLRLGLPLLGPNTTRFLPPGQQGFNATVLGAIRQPIGFIAVHDAYLPFLYQAPATVPTAEEMLRAVLASANSVDRDLTTLRTQLGAVGIHAPFALTEYSSLMSIGFGLPFDGVPVSLAGALYTADLLCTLAQRDDIDSAEHWSLVGNWYFGAMYWGGAPRPVYRVLKAMKGVLVGRRLRATVLTPMIDAPAFGGLPAQTAVPLVASCATGNGSQAQAVLVNRSTTKDLSVRLSFLGGATGGGMASVRTLNASDPLAVHDEGTTTPDWVATSVRADVGGVTVDLPAHAIVLVSIPAPVN